MRSFIEMAGYFIGFMLIMLAGLAVTWLVLTMLEIVVGMF